MATALVNRRPSRYGVHLLIWSALAAYLSLSNTLYVHYFLKSGKPVTTTSIVPPTTKMAYSIDHFQLVSNEGELVYVIEGWAFPRNSNVPLERYRKQVVLVDEESRAYLFDAEIDSLSRPDVTRAFPDQGKDLDLSGFSVYLSHRALRAGSYRFGILYTDSNSSPVYFLSNKFIVRTPNTLQLRDSPLPRNDSIQRVVAWARRLVRQTFLAIDPTGNLLLRVKEAIAR